MRVQPTSPLATRLAQYPPTDGHEITALFRNGYEIIRKHDSSFRLAPSNECLSAGESLRHEIHLRLVVQHEFATVQSMAQAALNGLPFQGMLVHRGLKKLVVIPPIVLGIQHGNIGVLNERLCIRPIIRVDPDSNAHSDL